MTQPLVYTTLGNVPADSLEYHKEWLVQPEVIKFREFYVDKATGQIVKDSVHVYLPQGVTADALAAAV